MKKNISKKKENNNIFILVLFAIIIILVLFLPKIYNFIETLRLPKIEKEENKEIIEKKEIDEETLDSVHYPLMRSSMYDQNTYYTLDEFSISDMSNNDILLNAFLDIYSGNIVGSDVSGDCTSESKQFNQDYIELRIKNILGKNLNYTLENFYVPEDSSSNFVGEWVYDNYNSRYVYKGLCQTRVTNTKYYNLEELVKAEYDKEDIIVYYYVGFAKVEGNSYIIYSDPKMGNELLTGTLNDSSELRDIFSTIDDKDKKIYKYTFKNTLCSYNEYCLYKGEWVNEF